MKEENLLQTNFKIKIILVIVFNILIIFGLVYLVILPAIDNLQQNKMMINDKKNELEVKSFQMVDIKSYFNEYKNIESQLFILDNILLNQEKSLNFINDLDQIAVKNNVIAKINLLQNKSKEISLYNRIPIVFSVEGDFSNLIKYLVDLETLDYYINIGSLEFVRDSMSDENSVIIMRISAYTYWEK